MAIFASGAGTNAARIIEHFRYNKVVSIKLIVSNKAGAGVLDIAKENNIESLLIEKELFFRDDPYIVHALQERKIDWVILAGFLWKIPSGFIRAFPNHIINIHPALLPRYGGKGMYGHHVHEAVIANKEKESGITIHYVDEWYDHGKILFQASCTVEHDDDATSLAKKIHALEHLHYPKVIEELVQK